MLQDSWKSSLTREQEATTSRVNLEDDDPATVKRLLLYIYLQDYIDTDPEPCSSWIPPLLDDDDEGEDDDKDDEHYLVPPPSAHGLTTAEIDAETKALANASHPRLLANISVYALADKYDIPTLKSLAKSKFGAVAWQIWPHEDFSTVIQEVFESTPSSDTGLRGIVTEVCIKHLDEILNNKAYTPTLQTTPALTYSLLRSSQTITATAQTQLSQQCSKFAALQAQQAETTKRFASWDKNVRTIFTRAKELRNCYRCGYRGNWEFVRVEHAVELKAIARCLDCRGEQPLC